jgi:hypothetical protein
MTDSKPIVPKPGTDNARMLAALQGAYPAAAWDLNDRLKLTANSRAAELRKLGWDVEAVRQRDPFHPKGKRNGYVLRTPRFWWTATLTTTDLEVVA